MLRRWSIGGMCCGCDVLGLSLSSSTRAMLVVVMADQGGGMYIEASTATLEALSMTDNSASSGPDIEVYSASITCSTSCTAGQYNEQCDIAMSNEGNLQCPINCEVSELNVIISLNPIHNPTVYLGMFNAIHNKSRRVHSSRQPCASCPAGTSSTTAGMSNSSCLACPTGYVSSQPGSSTCVGCAAGRFATDETNEPGVISQATICSDCEAGCVIIHEHS